MSRGTRITQEDIDFMINEFIKFAKSLNRCPLERELTVLYHDGIIPYQMLNVYRKSNMTYIDFCNKYIPEFYCHVPKEQIIEEFQKAYDKLGRVPYFTELKSVGIYHDKTLLFNRFNVANYKELIQALGWDTKRKTSARKSDSQLLEEYNQLFIKLKRIPYYQDIWDSKEVSGLETYVNRFGSIKNVCDLLDIDYNVNYKQSNIGKYIFDNNGVLCKSEVEVNISNYFIQNDILYKKDPYYSELYPCKDKRKFDWRIDVNNKTFYIEYLGMYNPKNNKTIFKTYIQKSDKKISDLNKAGVIHQCIFIYPIDIIQNNNIKNIFEKLLNIPLKDFVYERFYSPTKSPYGNFSNDELLKEINKYTDDLSILPSSKKLSKINNRLYTEIISRFHSYEKCGSYYNLTTRLQIKCKNSKK